MEDSQRHKMELTAEKLQIKAGIRVLDLGCGFGGLSRHLAKNFDIEVVGITNSSSMAAYAGNVCRELPVEIREIDWREICEKEETFDRIVGIEILFHIGSHNLEAFYKKLFNLLKPEGILVLQDFSVRKDSAHNLNFLQKFVFPGHYMYSLAQIFEISEKYFGLEEYLDMSRDMAIFFREALHLLRRNWDTISDKYDERVFQIYEIFFAAASVDEGMFSAGQMVFQKLRKSL
ncbi:cyclopropane-fatty-acyl-phospholipid synthase [Folsomia candida]|nr:cyclopropane-fatty-acyl-phospholipid synthase [Folsomia candida]